jgi:hypothetical protein
MSGHDITASRITHAALGFVLIAQRRESTPHLIAHAATHAARRALPADELAAVARAIEEICEAMHQAWVASGQAREQQWDTP